MSGPPSSPGASGPKMAVEGLRAGYGAVDVVRELDLEVPAGRISVVLGPNGAGKSTTCKALAGLVPATAGRILLDGDDVTRRPGWWRAQHGVLLIPEGRGIFPGLSVDENLAVLLPSPSDRAQVYERFAILGERRRQHAGSLSGGQQQLLSLAPTLVHRTGLLNADEPTLGLAPRVADDVLAVFDELRRAGGTVLLVGESPRGLVDIADQVALLHAGRITWSGPPDALERADLEASYFGDAAARPREDAT
jgi:ABC-type branched-subunit amino acid transport system ATPase component